MWYLLWLKCDISKYTTKDRVKIRIVPFLCYTNTRLNSLGLLMLLSFLKSRMYVKFWLLEISNQFSSMNPKMTVTLTTHQFSSLRVEPLSVFSVCHLLFSLFHLSTKIERPSISLSLHVVCRESLLVPQMFQSVSWSSKVTLRFIILLSCFTDVVLLRPKFILI